MYVLPVGRGPHRLVERQYADDLSSASTNNLSAVDIRCASDVSVIVNNALPLNPVKTEAVVFAIPFSGVDLSGWINISSACVDLRYRQWIRVLYEQYDSLLLGLYIWTDCNS